MDVIEDIKVGHYTRNIGYNFIVKGKKKNWIYAALSTWCQDEWPIPNLA